MIFCQGLLIIHCFLFLGDLFVKHILHVFEEVLFKNVQAEHGQPVDLDLGGDWSNGRSGSVIENSWEVPLVSLIDDGLGGLVHVSTIRILCWIS
mmetsp:Transcript_7137/g.13528  ORF Transcript_7137/g.13528 Transcript_7137/m.13528 type:complete len:94 (+) Transcript_7137:127-408(+)